MLTLAHREMVCGFVHNNDTIFEFNCMTYFDRLTLAARKDLHFVIRGHIHPQPEFSNNVRALFAHLFKI